MGPSAVQPARENVPSYILPVLGFHADALSSIVDPERHSEHDDALSVEENVVPAADPASQVHGSNATPQREISCQFIGSLRTNLTAKHELRGTSLARLLGIQEDPFHQRSNARSVIERQFCVGELFLELEVLEGKHAKFARQIPAALGLERTEAELTAQEVIV